MRSMQHFDNLFFQLRNNLGLSGAVIPRDINFHCFKASMEYLESRCGKLSEYAYQYIRLLA